MIPASSDLDASAHILVVDDEPDIVESLADYLTRKEGYRITAAHDGREAVEILQASLEHPTEEIDLVLTDMWMPEMGGLDVLSWLRQHPVLQYTRVVMLTAATGNQDKIQALSAGADDYITKPYHSQELLARVKTILRTQQLEKQLHRQSQQLAALNQVSQSVTAALDVRPVLATAVEGVSVVLGASVAAAYLYHSEKELLVCQQWQGPGELSFPPVRIGEGIVGQAFSRAQTLCRNTSATEDHLVLGPDAPANLVVRAIVAAPLVVRGRAVGVLTAINKPGDRFSEVDIDLLTSLASSISRAIENAWLFQSLQLRQHELLESRNTLQTVIDGILHPIYMVTDNYHIVAVNKTKSDELAAAPESLMGQVCYQVFFDRQTPCDHCQVAQTLAGQQPHSWPVRWLGPDHLPREWDVNAYHIPATHAVEARAVVVWQDRTEEHRLEQSLLQAGKLAAIGQLAAGVAHEINNPLTAINANAQMLQMVIDPDDENYEAVDLIVRAGDRATKVVRHLLDFARQEQYEFASSDLNHSLRQALQLIAYQLQSANIEVDLQLTDGLPELVASWEHMKSVWINLAINARDAVQSRPDNRRIEIVTRMAPEGDHVQVLFRDNGTGMVPAELAHIFEPFYTTKDPGKGTGLGLATSLRIIEQHGGEIEVASNSGEGTTFVVRLPLERDGHNGDNKHIAPRIEVDSSG